MLNRFIISSSIDWTELLLMEDCSKCSIFIGLKVNTMLWISTFAITKIYTDGSLDTFKWIRFVKLLGFHARWNKKSCKAMFIISLTPISLGLRSSPTHTLLNHNPWIFLYHSQFYVFYWHSSSVILICGCFLACHVFLRVAMTSSTQGKITGYLPRALIWIGNVFVYHTCQIYNTLWGKTNLKVDATIDTVLIGICNFIMLSIFSW